MTGNTLLNYHFACIQGNLIVVQCVNKSIMFQGLSGVIWNELIYKNELV